MKEILFATHNIGKLNEVRSMLGKLNIKVVSMSDLGVDDIDVIEDGETFEENSFKKASELNRILNIPVLADDSGLCVDALNQAPGIFSARFAGEHGNSDDNNNKLLEMMKDVEDDNRSARFVCVMTLVGLEKEPIVSRGEVEGYILRNRCADGGFGYDPLFFCTELNKCFGDCTSDEKNKVSHRFKALEQICNMIVI